MSKLVECIYCQKVMFASAREGDHWVCPHCSRRFDDKQVEEYEQFHRQLQRRQDEQRLWKDIQAKEALRKEYGDKEQDPSGS